MCRYRRAGSYRNVPGRNAKRVVFATGAHERPLVFRNVDCRVSCLHRQRITLTVSPLVLVAMLSSFTNNDSAYEATLDLFAAGVDVSLLVDARAVMFCNAWWQSAGAGIEIPAGAVVTRAKGFGKLRAVDVVGFSSDGKSAIAPKRTVNR